jgi:hypothetical protein
MLVSHIDWEGFHLSANLSQSNNHSAGIKAADCYLLILMNNPVLTLPAAIHIETESPSNWPGLFYQAFRYHAQ